MEIIKLAVPYVFSFFLGHFALTIITRKRPLADHLLHFFCAAGLGLAVSAQLTFLSYIIFDILTPRFVFGANITLLVILFLISVIDKRSRANQWAGIKSIRWSTCWPLLVMAVFSVPLWYEALFYIHGGWDAWSTWNLKARFLYLGGEHWKNILSPVLWRSSPHYPLLLPLINVWGWLWTGYEHLKIPMLTSCLFTLCTLGLLFSGLRKLTGSSQSIVAVIALLSMPFYIKIGMSQYCDIVLAYYLLSSFIFLILARQAQSKTYCFLAGLSLGALSFTKPEGTVAAAIIGALVIPYLVWNNTSVSKTRTARLIYTFIVSTVIAAIPTIIFLAVYSPGNQTMVNGLVSSSEPVLMSRAKIISIFYFLELISPNWNGIWIVLLLGILFSKGRCLHKDILIIPVFLFFYAAVISFYYFVNTYFQIDWWLQVTVHRIWFSVLPLVIFWCVYALWGEKK